MGFWGFNGVLGFFMVFKVFGGFTSVSHLLQLRNINR